MVSIWDKRVRSSVVASSSIEEEESKRISRCSVRQRELLCFHWNKKLTNDEAENLHKARGDLKRAVENQLKRSVEGWAQRELRVLFDLFLDSIGSQSKMSSKDAKMITSLRKLYLIPSLGCPPVSPTSRLNFLNNM